MSKRKQQASDNPYLIQMLFRFVGDQHGPCQAVIHQQQETPARANWEICFYQDTGLFQTLYESGTPQEKITQILWDLACKEQDSVGVVCYKTMYVCRECAQVMIGWQDAAIPVMANAQVRGCALLVVTDRLTEKGAIINNVPAYIQEIELLPLLQDEHLLEVELKPDE
jgi:hypothetical protein